MKWQLSGDWPVGAVVIPAGTFLVGVAGPDGEPVVPPDGTPLPMPIPINAIALDDEAAALMLDWYGGNWEHTANLDLSHRLLFGPNVNIDAARATARARKARR